MVTFVCENCDQTLKKRQVDRHIYQCRGAPRLVCIDCNKIFNGSDYRAHISCISEHEKTMGQYYKPKNKSQNSQNKQQASQSTSLSIPLNNKENGKENPSTHKEPVKTEIKNENNKEIAKEKWIGWKKTIRKTLQKQSNHEMNVGKLKKIVLKKFLEANENMDENTEEIFKKKIKNGRFKTNGDIIKYIPKSVRMASN